MADFDDTKNCPICLEFYEDKGTHTPRILNCFHTFCERCIKQLLKDGKLVCPECRATHCATNDFKSFPQNKYIVSNIRRNEQIETCDVHNREICVFCEKEDCQKPICIVCMATEHKDHKMKDFMQVKEEVRESLSNKAKLIGQNLAIKKEGLETAEGLVDEKLKHCLQKIKRRKEEQIKFFDDMMQEASIKVEKTKRSIRKDIKVFCEGIQYITKINENIYQSRYQGLVSCKEAILNMEKNKLGEKLDFETYHYPNYQETQTPQDICGKLIKMKVETDEVDALSKFTKFLLLLWLIHTKIKIATDWLQTGSRLASD